MSTQQAKFQLFSRLEKLGFTYGESVSLRRIEMTLQRWAEQECGDSNDYCSWAIERDEVTNKPYRVTYYHSQLMTEKVKRHAIADREAGALRRLHAIVQARNSRMDCHPLNSDYLIAYHQGDCRGCMLYLVTREQLTVDGKCLDVDARYTNGLAVCC
jgi:hypothetical protein